MHCTVTKFLRDWERAVRNLTRICEDKDSNKNEVILLQQDVIEVVRVRDVTMSRQVSSAQDERFPQFNEKSEIKKVRIKTPEHMLDKDLSKSDKRKRIGSVRKQA